MEGSVPDGEGNKKVQAEKRIGGEPVSGLVRSVRKIQLGGEEVFDIRRAGDSRFRRVKHPLPGAR